MKSYTLTIIILVGLFTIVLLSPNFNSNSLFYDFAESKELTDSDGDGIPEIDGRARVRAA